MAKKCKCIKDYKVSARDHLGNGVHGPIHDITLFEEGKEYWWFFKDKLFFVAKEQKFLRRMNYYSTDIEYMDVDTFFEYFNIQK